MQASTIRTSLLLAFILLSFFVTGTALAQPAPPPNPEPTSGENAAAVVAFFEVLAATAEGNKADCAAMGKALNSTLDKKQQVLRDAAYSPEVASAEQNVALTNAATALGTHAGACYEDASVAEFFDRLVKFTSELDKG